MQTQLRSDFDVVVVGAGPAGSVTAYRLAKAGVRVLVIDAKRFPREKACGGGIQRRASLKIPFEWDSVVHNDLRALSFSFGLGKRFTKGYEKTLVYSVLRAEFDSLLLKQAERAGATVWQGCKVTGVESGNSTGVTIQTERGEVRARFVVGADGANSIVARHLNPRDNYYWQAALYCEVPTECLNPGTVDSERMRVDWGSLPSGYGWIFPKKNSANVGVGCPASIARSLRPYLLRFLQAEKILRPGAISRLKFSGHQLPTLTRRTRLSSDNLVLVGDAAGLVEPLTGDGISHACHSAEIASDSILNGLAGRAQDRPSYDRRIRDEIGIELFWARQLLSLAVAFPRILYELFEHNDSVWNAFCGILRGEESFRHLRRCILGPFQLLWTPVRYFAEWHERGKLELHSLKVKA
ncbi:MAG: NAD(P)/FAD-dependent oxidoreductase [Acidobacteria bacterium]|nr:NAD(P)/FAD-dependent oxidoreductase [Acidobacteriota bacterium]